MMNTSKADPRSIQQARERIAMKRIFAVVLLMIAAASAGFAQAKNQEASRPETKRLDVRVEPFADLFFFVLRLSLGAGQTPDIEGFAQAVEAARPLRNAILTGYAFSHLAMPAISSKSAADLEKAFSQLPETARTQNGETIQLRENAVALAKALARVEDAFMEKLWPQRKIEIDKASAQIAQKLIPKERECFAYIARSLGMSQATGTVPLYLVTDAPRPGGFTFYNPSGRSVCLISITAHTGSLLFETALHEAIHALDIELAGEKNVLVEIRNRLMKAGLKSDDPDLRNVPHTLMFIQAAETIRRIIDPTHKHYGEVRGYYERVPLPSKIELPVWIAYLDGKITRDEAVTQIVEGFLKARSASR